MCRRGGVTCGLLLLLLPLTAPSRLPAYQAGVCPSVRPSYSRRRRTRRNLRSPDRRRVLEPSAALPAGFSAKGKPCDDPPSEESNRGAKSSPYSITERRVPELIPVLGSQPAGDVSHKPGVGCHYFPPCLQLPPQPLRGLLPISLLGEQRHNGCEQFA